MTQKNHGNEGKNRKHQSERNKKNCDADDHDARWENNQDNRNRNGNEANRGGIPRKVRDAFNRDYPNAKNVNWSKDRGVWSARFRRNGLFGGNATASYKANGERLSNSNFAYNH